jgi:flagellar hook-length control protein FliK
VVWSLKNNEEKIRLTLEPPQLGNIYMEIYRDKENIKATLWTDNPVTKEILEAHQIQIHKILKDDGFTLEKFSVFVQQDMTSFQGRGENSIAHGQSTRTTARDDQGSQPPELSEMVPILKNLPYGDNQVIDIFV